MQKKYRAALLSGEVRKPEGNSSVTLGNAINRFAEIDCIQVRAGKGRERLVNRGPNFAELGNMVGRIVAGVMGV